MSAEHYQEFLAESRRRLVLCETSMRLLKVDDSNRSLEKGGLPGAGVSEGCLRAPCLSALVDWALRP